MSIDFTYPLFWIDVFKVNLEIFMKNVQLSYKGRNLENLENISDAV